MALTVHGFKGQHIPDSRRIAIKHTQKMVFRIGHDHTVVCSKLLIICAALFQIFLRQPLFHLLSVKYREL